MSENISKELSTQFPREEMINTAIKFLTNPKVRTSSKEMKTMFLAKKGLTEVEISQAFKRLPSTTTMALDQNSNWVPWFRNNVNIIVFSGGLIYATYYFWKNYVKRWIQNQKSKDEKNWEMLLNLHSKLNELSLTLSKVERSSSQPSEMMDLKLEIQSLKSLFLSSKRFPSAPKIVDGFSVTEDSVNSSSSSIPQWQQNKDEDYEKENEKNLSNNAC